PETWCPHVLDGVRRAGDRAVSARSPASRLPPGEHSSGGGRCTGRRGIRPRPVTDEGAGPRGRRRRRPRAERQVRMTAPTLERAVPRCGGVGLTVMTRTDPAPSPDAGLSDPASTARGSDEAGAPDAGAPDSGAPDFDFASEALSHLDSLYGGALRMTRNPHDAEDLVQETFVKAFRARDRFTPGTHMRAWLYRIMTNSYISLYRKKQRRPKEAWTDTVEDWQLAEVAGHTSSGLRSAETEALDHLPDSAVKDALGELREDYRMAVYLADVEGFAY